MSRTIGLVLALSALALMGALTLPLSARAAEAPFPEPPFEIQGFAASVTNELGAEYTQAGGHPYQAETAFHFPPKPIGSPEAGEYAVEFVRETVVELPPGFIGNPQATPQCTLAQLNQNIFTSACPAASRVGTLTLNSQYPFSYPVYNIVPERGYAAEFGADVAGKDIVVYGSVRSGSDYGLTVTTPGIIGAGITEYRFTFFGVPAAQNGSGGALVPFLTNPTNCAAAEVTRIKADTWQHPGVWYEATKASPNVTGCEKLPFKPTIAVTTENATAGAPAGYDVDLHIPQNENTSGLAEAALKKAVVTLPAGVSVSPSVASGLGACTPAEIALYSSEAANCPDSSKIGSVEVDTPLLDHSLEGGVYLASQGENPFNSLLALYIAVSDPQTGVVIKLAGQVSANPVTGQLTATFDNNPQLPFEDLKLDFNGGPRAALVNPAECGTYTTTTELTPYSETAPVTPSSSFQINQGCASPQPFAPAFTAGTVNPQAGAFSPFGATFSRSDAEQTFGALSVKTPPGVTGVLTGVPLCAEPQAAQGTCGQGSLIGHTTVQAGPGTSPFGLGGQVFLTGPYKGAPFGLSIVVPAVAGPFNLGTVVVRASIAVDPTTAQLTVTSDPLPQILQGIPLDLQSVNVTIDRSNFTLNPTNCSPLAVSGVAQSTQNADVALSSPFAVGSCASLKFAPKFSASTLGKASKADGASLTTKLSFPTTQGEANIAKVKVELPKQLPSRLTTLQKACTAAQFEANPAGCPAASFIGHATVHTPLLPVPLTGPAVFVSHGGEAFPSLVIVLQGYGVKVDLVGTTLIKSGVTSTTFKTVPDVPFSTFELTLAQGKYSALGANLPAKANYSFCGQKLAMPTTFTAQNGVETHQATPVAVEGCSSSLSFTHRIRQKTLTLSVYAPAAGRITASGKGLTKASKTAKGQETITLTLKQKKAGKLKTTVKLAFTPSTGKDREKQAKNAKVVFAK
ncbi:MAG: hypothetical protein WB998_10900 [Solirubrobacteraceae bacterium]